MAQSQQEQEVLDLYPSLYDPNVYLYDPDPRARYSKRRRRAPSYDPRHRRRYDPQPKFFRRIRRAGGKLRKAKAPRKGIMGKITKFAFKFSGWPLAIIAGISAISAGDRAAFTGPKDPVTMAKLSIASTVMRLSGGAWNIYPALGLGTGFTVSGWNFNLNKALNNGFWAGVGALIYGHLPFALPFKGVARKGGKSLSIASFLMGGLDPSPTSGSTSGYASPATKATAPGTSTITVAAGAAGAPQRGSGWGGLP